MRIRSLVPLAVCIGARIPRRKPAIVPRGAREGGGACAEKDFSIGYEPEDLVVGQKPHFPGSFPAMRCARRAIMHQNTENAEKTRLRRE